MVATYAFSFVDIIGENIGDCIEDYIFDLMAVRTVIFK